MSLCFQSTIFLSLKYHFNHFYWQRGIQTLNRKYFVITQVLNFVIFIFGRSIRKEIVCYKIHDILMYLDN